jgi:hypothetical protein
MPATASDIRGLRAIGEGLANIGQAGLSVGAQRQGVQAEAERRRQQEIENRRALTREEQVRESMEREAEQFRLQLEEEKRQADAAQIQRAQAEQARQAESLREFDARLAAMAVETTGKPISDPRTQKEFNILAQRYGLGGLQKTIGRLDGPEPFTVEAGANIKGLVPAQRVRAPGQLLDVAENRQLSNAFRMVSQEPTSSRMKEFEELLVNPDGTLTDTAQNLDPEDLQSWIGTLDDLRKARNAPAVKLRGALGIAHRVAKEMAIGGTIGLATGGAGTLARPILRGAGSLAGRFGAPTIGSLLARAGTPGALGRAASSIGQRFGLGRTAAAAAAAPAAGQVAPRVAGLLPAPSRLALAQTRLATPSVVGPSAGSVIPNAPRALLPASAFAAGTTAEGFVPGTALRALAQAPGTSGALASGLRTPSALALGGGLGAMAMTPETRAADTALELTRTPPGTALDGAFRRVPGGREAILPDAVIINGSRIPMPRLEGASEGKRAAVQAIINEIQVDPSGERALKVMERIRSDYEKHPTRWTPQEYNEVIRTLGQVRMERLLELGSR